MKDNILRLNKEKNSITSLRTSDGIEELHKRVLKILNGLGFSDFDVEALGTGIDSACIMSTLPDAIYQAYFDEKLYEDDMVLECMRHSTLPVFQEDIYKYLNSCPHHSVRVQKSRQSIQLVKAYGYHNGYYIPVDLQSIGRKYIVSILTENKDSQLFECHTRSMSAILNQIAESICWQLSRPGFVKEIKFGANNILTERQVEVLEALSNFARTNEQVANHLGISVRTVHKHVDDIKAALGACSVPNAISLAIGRGIIRPAY